VKKQRWRKTKPVGFCENCGEPIFIYDNYAVRYGFCNVSCGMELYDLVPGDFY
jgi:hypothetical protein